MPDAKPKNNPAFMGLKQGDTIQMRKKHPCGNDCWGVVQTGIDIRIKCQGCQKQLLVDRTILERKVKEIINQNTKS
jgi:hypothetical protein